LRYVAFPYQKFGQHQGKIINVSRVALSGKDLNEINVSPTVQQSQFYRITVSLPAQNILAYGKPEPLQAGMDVEADILIDTRHLYEWLFEPLYSIAGKI
jgi:membrane fusion protein